MTGFNMDRKLFVSDTEACVIIKALKKIAEENPTVDNRILVKKIQNQDMRQRLDANDLKEF